MAFYSRLGTRVGWDADDNKFTSARGSIGKRAERLRFGRSSARY